MNQDQVKQNLLSPAQWLRMLLMFGYLVALWVLGMVLLIIVLTQTVVTLIVGEANANLRDFGVALAEYVRQVVAFLVYGTEERPFPFAPFPAVPPAEPAPVDTATAAAAPPVDPTGTAPLHDDTPAFDADSHGAATEAPFAAADAPQAPPTAAPTDADLHGDAAGSGETRDEPFRN